jgi:hypothetical protein
MLQFSTSLQLCYAGEKQTTGWKGGKVAVVKKRFQKSVNKTSKTLRALTVCRCLVGDVKIREDIEKYCHVLCTIMQ